MLSSRPLSITTCQPGAGLCLPTPLSSSIPAVKCVPGKDVVVVIPSADCGCWLLILADALLASVAFLLPISALCVIVYTAAYNLLSILFARDRKYLTLFLVCRLPIL